MAIKELFFEGKTIEAAVELAAAELNEDKDLLSYTVEETPTKGIFGIGATRAEGSRLGARKAFRRQK